MKRNADWNPEAYNRFRDLRLRPALDLLAQVHDAPEQGAVVDLGCGNGVLGPALKQRFGNRIVGIDSSDNMQQKARETDAYVKLENADIAEWKTESAALIFSNAALHWLPNHKTLFPKLAKMLAPRGVLAVQMPRQFMAPSHQLLRDTAHELFPERFDYSSYKPPVSPPEAMVNWLSSFGALNVWETSYFQRLEASDGHPVRQFTSSTAARPILAKLTPPKQMRFLEAYDNALQSAYPRQADGSCIFPFLRQFIVLERHA